MVVRFSLGTWPSVQLDSVSHLVPLKVPLVFGRVIMVTSMVLVRNCLGRTASTDNTTGKGAAVAATAVERLFTTDPRGIFIVANILNIGQTRMTRLALGIPVGGELEYLDTGTLSHAIQARQPMNLNMDFVA